MLSEYIKYSKFNTAGRRSSCNSFSQEKCIHGLAVFIFWRQVMKLCECGCGQPTKIIKGTNKNRGYKRGEYYKFLHGHATKGKTGIYTKERLEQLREARIGNKFWAGRKHTKESKNKNRESHIGNRHNSETIKKMSGKNHPNWKGGITPLHMTIRNSIKYKLYRESIFTRDNWTCQECKKRSKANDYLRIEVHHIKPFALFPKLRFKIDNGVTLCKKCHDKKPKGREIKEY